MKLTGFCSEIPVLQFSALRVGPSISGPAISGPAFSAPPIIILSHDRNEIWNLAFSKDKFCYVGVP